MQAIETNQHPIIPPPELVEQRWNKTQTGGDFVQEFAAFFARWGADQQLAKDAEWLDQHALDAPHLKTTPVGESLKEAMRPKPSSLKEQALSLLAKTDGPIMLGNPEYRLWESEVEIIRRALKALPE